MTVWIIDFKSDDMRIRCNACKDDISYDDAVSNGNGYYCYPCAAQIYDFETFPRRDN